MQCPLFGHILASVKKRQNKKSNVNTAEKTVSMTKGNTNNLFQHLEHSHVTEYEQCIAHKHFFAQQQVPPKAGVDNTSIYKCYTI